MVPYPSQCKQTNPLIFLSQHDGYSFGLMTLNKLFYGVWYGAIPACSYDILTRWIGHMTYMGSSCTCDSCMTLGIVRLSEDIRFLTPGDTFLDLCSNS